MPLTGWRGKPPEPEPEPQSSETVPEFQEEGLSDEQVAIIHSRWRNLTDPLDKGGGGFTPEQAFILCGNPRLDWHFARHLNQRGCNFETIVKLTS